MYTTGTFCTDFCMLSNRSHYHYINMIDWRCRNLHCTHSRKYFDYWLAALNNCTIAPIQCLIYYSLITQIVQMHLCWKRTTESYCDVAWLAAVRKQIITSKRTRWPQLWFRTRTSDTQQTYRRKITGRSMPILFSKHSHRAIAQTAAAMHEFTGR